MYGCEAWTMSKQADNHLMAVEMGFLRKMQRIPRTDRKTNDQVLQETNEDRKLIREIKLIQSTLFGHVMRRNKLENLVTTGKIEGTRAKGRPRSKYLEALTMWHGRDRYTELIHDSINRVRWGNMTTHAYRHVHDDDDDDTIGTRQFSELSCSPLGINGGVEMNWPPDLVSLWHSLWKLRWRSG